MTYPRKAPLPIGANPGEIAGIGDQRSTDITMQCAETRPQLDYTTTQQATAFAKRKFADELAGRLRLMEIDAPPALPIGTGLHDDLAGTQTSVKFTPTDIGEPFQIVHSLAKWKRHQLGRLNTGVGSGLITDMRAIRKEEVLSPTHSIYVDQWDWEQVIGPEDRSISFLKQTVRAIYAALLATQNALASEYGIEPVLDEEVSFVHTQTLEDRYPDLASEEREEAWVKQEGSSFFIGIGHPLESGQPHDVRATDYDDWSTPTELGRGLNGDLVVWHPEREEALELTSMGIRVDAESLDYQLRIRSEEDKRDKPFHRELLDGKLPLTVGGGIGQSRVCMLLLRKVHIGQVQAGLWPEQMRRRLAAEGIELL